jgi:propanediol utilization protein
MNYRDVVLKLLKKRKEVVVVEGIMLADFNHHSDPEAAFEQWCQQNYVQKARIPDTRNIILTKSTITTSSQATSKDLEIQDD